MNFQFISSSYDLLIHNVQDNIIKVVRLDQSSSCLDETIKEYITTFVSELDLDNFEIKWPTDTKAEIYTYETRVQRGWVYNSKQRSNTLLYQIRPVEVFGSFTRTRFADSETQTETQTDAEDADAETEAESDVDTDVDTNGDDSDESERAGYEPLKSEDSDEECDFSVEMEPVKNPVYFKFQNSEKRSPFATYSNPFDQPCLFDWRQGQCNPFAQTQTPPAEPITVPPFPLYYSKSDFIAELTDKLSCTNFGLSSTPCNPTRINF
jgi:hypothetical protein